MKKKLLAMLMVFTVIAQMLTGCSLGRPSGEGGNAGAKGTVLQIGIEAKGYGDEFAYKLAEAYQAKTGIKTEVAKASAGEWTTAALTSGAKNNDIDVFFDIRDTAMKDVAVSNYLEGYERAYIDLSDLYDEVPDGYNTDKTLEELFDPYAVRACTWDVENEGFGDGKQYFVSYVAGMEGLIYNADLFEKYNLNVPKTTTEFFALLDQLKTIEKGGLAKNSDGRKIYPYVYSNTVRYTEFMSRVWWAQYDGLDAFNNVYEGKNGKDEYTAESSKTAGKLSALTHTAKLLAQDSGYTDPVAVGENFTNVQVLFLDNQAFMTTTGDWVEREMSGNFEGTAPNIAFMRIPLNSDIVKKCDTVTTEERLVETIAYIDGETAERPAYLSDADLTLIAEARSIYSSEGNQHVAYIPAYSNMVDEAKDFLRFMLSKEGQEIMLKYSYGNMAPLLTDVSQFEAYEGLSTLQKSKYEMISTGSGLALIGENRSHPMAYAGGLEAFQSSMEVAFGAVKTSKSFKTPMKYWEDDYQEVVGIWDDAVQKSGIKNLKK